MNKEEAIKQFEEKYYCEWCDIEKTRYEKAYIKIICNEGGSRWYEKFCIKINYELNPLDRLYICLFKTGCAGVNPHMSLSMVEDLLSILHLYYLRGKYE